MFRDYETESLGVVEPLNSSRRHSGNLVTVGKRHDMSPVTFNAVFTAYILLDQRELRLGYCFAIITLLGFKRFRQVFLFPQPLQRLRA